MTTREIAERFGMHHTTVADRLKKFCIVKKVEVWVPHKRTEKNIMDRILVCESPEMELFGPISEADHPRSREMGCLQQYPAAEVVVPSRRVFTNGGKTRFVSAEDDAQRLVELQRSSFSSYSKRSTIHSSWPNDRFEEVLRPVRQIARGSARTAASIVE